MKLYSWTAHAEMRAIIMYLIATKQNKKRRRNHGKKAFDGNVPKTLYVVSFNNGIWKNSRPCDDCIKIMRYYGVKKVIYTTGLEDPDKFLMCEKVDEMEFMGKSYGNKILEKQLNYK